MNEAFVGATEPETDYSVWGFTGDPPILDGGSLNDESHLADAEAAALADGWKGSVASYLVHDVPTFESAASRLKLSYTNMNEIEDVTSAEERLED
jgi:hypothetical protein